MNYDELNVPGGGRIYPAHTERVLGERRRALSEGPAMHGDHFRHIRRKRGLLERLLAHFYKPHEDRDDVTSKAAQRVRTAG